MASDKIVAIVNPTAGKGKCARIWPEIVTYLSSLGLSVDACFTKQAGDATKMAKQACERGVTRILSVGGDGTLNEVVNGIARHKVTLGVIPAGSGNDFVRSLGLQPDDWQGACQIIASGHVQPMDLGQIDDRYFINVSGVGFDAAVANCFNLWAKQRFPDKIAYIAALLRMLIEFHSTEITIQLDDEVFCGQGWLVAVGNAKYFGGGMKVTPKAEIDDGLFDVCILGELSKPGFLRAFPSVFKGNHLSHPAVHYYRSRCVKVQAKTPLLVQADGELIGQTPQLFQLLPRQLQIYSQHKEQLASQE